MATSMDLFRKLGAGLKFDLHRFKSDAEKFQVIKSRPKPASKQEITRALDIFSTANNSGEASASASASSGSHERPGTTEGQKKRKAEEGGGLTSGKTRSKKRKKKDAAVACKEEESDEDGSGLRLMASLQPQQKEQSPNPRLSAEKQEQKRREQVNVFRKQHKIHVWGTDIPDPVATFDQLQREYGLHTDIVENVHCVGFVEPTQIQMQAVPVMMHRRELLACAPTGSGKTAAFILPVLAHLKEPKKKGFRAVVVSPTRELANQTYREFQRLGEGRGLRTHTIQNTAQAAKQFGPESSQKFDILVTTPNRLVYLLNQEPPAIKLNNVEWLIVDESDKLFEEGKSGFRDQLATIYRACDSTHVRRAMFSATFTHNVERWCKLNLDNVVTVTIGQKNTATDLIQQELVFVGGEYGKLLAVREIFRKGFQPPILVFVQSKDRAKELFHELVYDGYNVDIIHADKTQTQRDNIVKCFRLGQIWVLIATELMGRGIDFKGINLVINYDFPTSAISYIHRIGRTGRAGRPGKAVTFFTEDDAVHLRSIANVMRNAGCPVPEYMLQLKKLSKGKRKKLEREPVKRDSIRTLPKQDLDKAKKKKEIIKKALKGQGKGQQGSGVTQHAKKPQMTGAKKRKQANPGSKVKPDENPQSRPSAGKKLKAKKQKQLMGTKTDKQITHDAQAPTNRTTKKKKAKGKLP